PEDVYPSILILQSVNVDRSGVMITTGIASGDPADVTIAFSRGVGGAVDGQAAESWLMTPSEVRLLSPAREPTYRSLPTSGGTSVVPTSYEERLLGPAELSILRELASDVKARLPDMPGMHSQGPWDVELGFQTGKLWLFQVRPFVENRSAESTTYLQNLDVQPKQPRRRTPNSR
ncbi:MAG: phosphoenolpyruvate synthase, partial [Rhodothermales bacterium]|nr:phosphoenolpyruvate synthase [Rhodothermales bacterium]